MYISFSVVFFIFFSETVAAKILRLATETGRPLNKKGLPYMKCVLAKLELPREITSMPWARAQLSVEHGLYDGFFTASRNEERDRYAVLSEPFFNINWMYVVRKDSSLLPNTQKFQQGIFATKMGTSSYAWLKDKYDRGIIAHKIIAPSDATNALTMLDLGRVDIFLGNNINLEIAFKQTGFEPSNFKTFVVRAVPVGIYFSKAFLDNNLGFIDKFNESIKGCVGK
jgi:ABC-type amino acid transport substrate-binding protein